MNLVENIIRLGGTKTDPNSPAQRFIANVNAATKEHPFDHRSRLHGMVSLTVYPSIDDRNGCVRISDIRAIEQRNGHASLTMRQLCSEADRLGVNLELTAKSYSDEGMDTSQLKRWYESFGFVEDPDTFGDDDEGYDMLRVSRGS